LLFHCITSCSWHTQSLNTIYYWEIFHETVAPAFKLFTMYCYKWAWLIAAERTITRCSENKLELWKSELICVLHTSSPHMTHWFAVSGYIPTEPVHLDDSNNNFVALYVFAATVGALLFIVLTITLIIHKCVRPIPLITSLVPCISNNNNRGTYQGHRVRRLHFPGDFRQLVVDNNANHVIGVDVMVRA